MEYNELVRPWEYAFQMLYEKDIALFETDVQERSIAGRLAIYLQHKYDGGFRNKIKLQPWKNYRIRINPDKKAKRFILEENAGTPAWWNAYNGAKHDRAGNNGDNYKNASLQNVLTALSGLYSLEASLLENTFDPSNDETLPMRLESRLFDKKLKYYTNYVSCTD